MPSQCSCPCPCSNSYEITNNPVPYYELTNRYSEYYQTDYYLDYESTPPNFINETIEPLNTFDPPRLGADDCFFYNTCLCVCSNPFSTDTSAYHEGYCLYPFYSTEDCCKDWCRASGRGTAIKWE
ncbi:MAG: hypothetical protein Harvfovirus27_13 [Harvfovirus sp.]|uniref:Uncharacterized protein n=1 Tax=Harvfovirus sp. TaxID=2487768 RepID=A0A3G5A4C1_9VIRU|nr:MAG: hypothetical protein Harvfovirus27_13 [Harvfovirus sp.]